jgi:hypothetical protein
MASFQESTTQPWLFTFRRHPVLFSFVVALFLDLSIRPIGRLFFGGAEQLPLWYLVPLRLVSLGVWLLFVACLLYAVGKLAWLGFKLLVGGEFANKVVEWATAAIAVIGMSLWVVFILWFDIGQHANSVGESANGWTLIFNGIRNCLNFIAQWLG